MPPPGGESLKDTGARVWPYYLHDLQPQLAALAFARDAAEGEEHDQQRREHLQHEGRCQLAKAQQHRRLGGVAEVGAVLAVTFQKQRAAGEWIDAEIEEGEGTERPKHIVPVVDDTVRVAIRPWSRVRASRRGPR